MKRNEQIDGTEFACLTINADLEAENERLKKQLALTEKALELACERIAETDKHKCKVCYSYGDDACIGYKPMCCEYIKKHFEWKAEQEMSDGI